MNLNRKWSEKDYDELLTFIKLNADEDYRKFNSKIVNSEMQMIGVRLPFIKSVAKYISKGDYKAFLKVSRADSFEEVMLKGLVIGFAESDFVEFCYQIEQFVPMIENWSICDSFVANLKCIKCFKSEFYSILQKYFTSEREFELRFAFVCLLDFYVEPEYLEKIYYECDKCKSEFYYVKMAIAWLISVCYIKYPEKTDEYLRENSLEKWTYNKALQKIIESNRVTGEQKKYIKGLKKHICKTDNKTYNIAQKIHD